MTNVLLIAQLLFASDYQGWVDSQTPAELCQEYQNGLIQQQYLPGGRSQTPCGDGSSPLATLSITSRTE